MPVRSQCSRLRNFESRPEYDPLLKLGGTTPVTTDALQRAPAIAGRS